MLRRNQNIAVVSSPLQVFNLGQFLRHHDFSGSLTVFLHLSKDAAEAAASLSLAREFPRSKLIPVRLLSSLKPRGPGKRGQQQAEAVREVSPLHGPLLQLRNLLDLMLLILVVLAKVGPIGSGILVIGDLLHGHGAKVASLLGRRARTILLDDGTATLEVARRRNLLWNSRYNSMPFGRRKSPVLVPAQLEYFTFFHNLEPPPTDTVHKFVPFDSINLSWSPEEFWVLGSNLASRGDWKLTVYLELISAVIETFSRHKLTAKYLPHRMETALELDQINRLCQVEMGLPLEQRISSGHPVAKTIVSFPSTAVFLAQAIQSRDTALHLVVPPSRVWEQTLAREPVERLIQEALRLEHISALRL